MYTTLSGNVKSTSRVRIDCNKRRRTRDNALKPLHFTRRCIMQFPGLSVTRSRIEIRAVTPVWNTFRKLSLRAGDGDPASDINPGSVMDKSYFATWHENVNRLAIFRRSFTRLCTLRKIASQFSYLKYLRIGRKRETLDKFAASICRDIPRTSAYLHIPGERGTFLPSLLSSLEIRTKFSQTRIMLAC